MTDQGLALNTSALAAGTNGRVVFTVLDTLDIGGPIAVTINYSADIGGASTVVGTINVPAPILPSLSCDKTVIGLRETAHCTVVKASGSADFSKTNLVIGFNGNEGTANVSNILNKPLTSSLNRVEFDVKALVLESSGESAVTVASTDTPEFPELFAMNISSGLEFTCPRTRMGKGQTVNCTATASISLVSSDMKTGWSSTGAFSFGSVLLASNALHLPVTAVVGSVQEELRMVLPSDDAIRPLTIDVAEATGITCTPSSGPTRTLLGTNARCTLHKSETSTSLLVSDFDIVVSGGASISAIVTDGNGNLNFTFYADTKCGSSGCTVTASYAAALGGAVAASNTFLVIDPESVVCPSGRKARGVPSPCVLTPSENAAPFITADVAPVVSSENFLVQTSGSVSDDGVLSIPLTAASAVLGGTYQVRDHPRSWAV
eukprot:tig00000405_g443.t1